MDEAKHTIAEVAAAAGIKVATIRSWYQRKQLTVGMSEGVDIDPAARGMARRVSTRTAIAIGIMAELTSNGIDAKRAAQAAMIFAHSGDEDRFPGQLFPDGTTWLAIGSERIGVVNVVNEDYREIFHPAYHGRNQLPIVTAIEVDDLVDRIRGRLRIDRDPLERPNDRPTGYAGDGVAG